MRRLLVAHCEWRAQHGAKPSGAQMQMHTHQQVLDRRDVPEQPDVLIGPAYAGCGNAVRRQSVNPLTGKPHLPRTRSQVLGDAVEYRGLASAIRSDDAVDAAFSYRKVQVSDRGQTTESHRQVIAAK
jgi:hypothetical protein